MIYSKNPSGSIQATSEARPKAIASGDQIDFSVYRGSLIPDDRKPGWMFGAGANIRPSAMTCDVLNHMNGFKAHLSRDRLKELVGWYASTPSPEILSGHYGAYRLGIIQELAFACDRIGWTREADLCRKAREYDLDLLACFATFKPMGYPRQADQAYGPRIVNCDVKPPNVRYRQMLAVACVGPRGDHLWHKSRKWLDIPAWQGWALYEIWTGKPNGGTSQAIQDRGGDWLQYDTRDLFRRAVMGHKDALEACWRVGKNALNPRVAVQLVRTNNWLVARTLETGGGKSMKGPRPAWFIEAAYKDDPFVKSRVVVGRGTADWMAFATKIGGDPSAGWVEAEFPEWGKLRLDLPKGDVIFTATYDRGNIADSLPDPNPPKQEVQPHVPYLPTTEERIETANDQRAPKMTWLQRLEMFFRRLFGH